MLFQDPWGALNGSEEGGHWHLGGTLKADWVQLDSSPVSLIPDWRSAVPAFENSLKILYGSLPWFRGTS